MAVPSPQRIRVVAWFLAGIMTSQPGCQTRERIGDHEKSRPLAEAFRVERQLTHGPGGRILTNTGVWSPDGDWIVYDTRSDAPGESFNGEFIELVNVRTGEVRKLYRARNGAHCGVVTFHPRE